MHVDNKLCWCEKWVVARCIFVFKFFLQTPIIPKLLFGYHIFLFVLTIFAQLHLKYCPLVVVKTFSDFLLLPPINFKLIWYTILIDVYVCHEILRCVYVFLNETSFVFRFIEVYKHHFVYEE